MTDYTDLAVTIDITVARTLTAAISGAVIGIQDGQISRTQFRAGDGTISGTLRVDGAVASRRVLILDERTGLLVSQSLSDETGAHECANLERGVPYIVIGRDHLGTAAADIKDKVIPT